MSKTWCHIFQIFQICTCKCCKKHISTKKAIFWDKRFLPFLHEPTFNLQAAHLASVCRWSARIWPWIVCNGCVLLVLVLTFLTCTLLSRPVSRRVGFVKPVTVFVVFSLTCNTWMLSSLLALFSRKWCFSSGSTQKSFLSCIFIVILSIVSWYFSSF